MAWTKDESNGIVLEYRDTETGRQFRATNTTQYYVYIKITTTGEGIENRSSTHVLDQGEEEVDMGVHWKTDEDYRPGHKWTWNSMEEKNRKESNGVEFVLLFKEERLAVALYNLGEKYVHFELTMEGENFDFPEGGKLEVNMSPNQKPGIVWIGGALDQNEGWVYKGGWKWIWKGYAHDSPHYGSEFLELKRIFPPPPIDVDLAETLIQSTRYECVYFLDRSSMWCGINEDIRTFSKSEKVAAMLLNKLSMERNVYVPNPGLFYDQQFVNAFQVPSAPASIKYADLVSASNQPPPEQVPQKGAELPDEDEKVIEPMEIEDMPEPQRDADYTDIIANRVVDGVNAMKDKIIDIKEDFVDNPLDLPAVDDEDLADAGNAGDEIGLPAHPSSYSKRAVEEGKKQLYRNPKAVAFVKLIMFIVLKVLFVTDIVTDYQVLTGVYVNLARFVYALGLMFMILPWIVVWPVCAEWLQRLVRKHEDKPWLQVYGSAYVMPFVGPPSIIFLFFYAEGHKLMELVMTVAGCRIQDAENRDLAGFDKVVSLMEVLTESFPQSVMQFTLLFSGAIDSSGQGAVVFSLCLSIISIARLFTQIYLESKKNAMSMGEYTLVVFQGSFSFVKRINNMIKEERDDVNWSMVSFDDVVTGKVAQGFATRPHKVKRLKISLFSLHETPQHIMKFLADTLKDNVEEGGLLISYCKDSADIMRVSGDPQKDCHTMWDVDSYEVVEGMDFPPSRLMQFLIKNHKPKLFTFANVFIDDINEPLPGSRETALTLLIKNWKPKKDCLNILKRLIAEGADNRTENVWGENPLCLVWETFMELTDGETKRSAKAVGMNDVAWQWKLKDGATDQTRDATSLWSIVSNPKGTSAQRRRSSVTVQDSNFRTKLIMEYMENPSDDALPKILALIDNDHPLALDYVDDASGESLCIRAAKNAKMEIFSRIATEKVLRGALDDQNKFSFQSSEGASDLVYDSEYHKVMKVGAAKDKMDVDLDLTEDSCRVYVTNKSSDILFVQPIIHHRPLKNAKLASQRFHDQCGADIVEPGQRQEIGYIVPIRPLRPFSFFLRVKANTASKWNKKNTQTLKERFANGEEILSNIRMFHKMGPANYEKHEYSNGVSMIYREIDDTYAEMFYENHMDVMCRVKFEFWSTGATVQPGGASRVLVEEWLPPKSRIRMVEITRQPKWTWGHSWTWWRENSWNKQKEEITIAWERLCLLNPQGYSSICQEHVNDFIQQGQREIDAGKKINFNPQGSFDHWRNKGCLADWFYIREFYQGWIEEEHNISHFLMYSKNDIQRVFTDWYPELEFLPGIDDVWSTIYQFYPVRNEKASDVEQPSAGFVLEPSTAVDLTLKIQGDKNQFPIKFLEIEDVVVLRDHEGMSAFDYFMLNAANFSLNAENNIPTRTMKLLGHKVKVLNPMWTNLTTCFQSTVKEDDIDPICTYGYFLSNVAQKLLLTQNEKGQILLEQFLLMPQVPSDMHACLLKVFFDVEEDVVVEQLEHRPMGQIVPLLHYFILNDTWYNWFLDLLEIVQMKDEMKFKTMFQMFDWSRLLAGADGQGNNIFHRMAKLDYQRGLDLILQNGEKKMLEVMNYPGNVPVRVALRHGEFMLAREMVSLDGRDIPDKQGKVFLMEDIDDRSFVSALRIFQDCCDTQDALDYVNSRDRAGRSVLHFVVLEGNESRIAVLLNSGVDCETLDEDGFTPLCIACREGKIKAVEMLLLYGANVNHKANDGNTPLLLACEEGHVGIVEILLTRGADIEHIQAKQNQGQGVDSYIKAITKRHTKVVKVLAEVFPKSTATHLGTPYSSALVYACKTECADIVPILVNAAPQLQNQLDLALFESAGRGNTATVQILIDNKADPNYTKQTKDQFHPVLNQACAGGHTATVNCLLASNADVEKKNKTNETALMSTCNSFNGNLAIVEALVAQKSDCFVQDSFAGNSAIMNAIQKQHRDIVKYFLELADERHELQKFYQYNNKKEGLLHFAADKGDKETVNMILEHMKEEEVDANSDQNETAFFITCKRGHAEVALLLLEKGAKIENSGADRLMEVASSEGQDEIIVVLLNRGVKPTVNAWLGGATKGAVKVCEILLDRQPELLEEKNENGNTAIIKAVVRNKPKMVEFLVSKGADLQVKWGKGKLVLSEAIYKNYTRVCKALIEGGADPNMKDFTGRVPLMRALNTKDEEVITLLMQHNADPNMIDPQTGQVVVDPDEGKTVMEMFEGEEEILKILKGELVMSPKASNMNSLSLDANQKSEYEQTL